MTTRITSLALAVVAVGGLASCTGPASRAVPATVSTRAASGQPSATAIASPMSLHFTATSRLAEYPAGATLDARTCDVPRGPWAGTLRIDQEYLAASDRVRAVDWTFDSNGRAELVVGPYHGRYEGKSYTVMFVVRMHLSGTSEVTVDDVIARQAKQANTSLRPFMIGLGVPRPMTSSVNEHC